MIHLCTIAYANTPYLEKLVETAALSPLVEEIFIHDCSPFEEVHKRCSDLDITYGRVRWVNYGKNRGCSACWNDSIVRAAHGGLMTLIVNDDAWFSPGDIEKIYKTAQDNPDAYMVSCAGWHVGFDTAVPSHGHSCFVLNPIGIETVGAFDENIFPAYLEDCLSPDTPILTADLRWIPIGDAVVGMEIVGVDEWNTSRQARRYRAATITGVTRRTSPSLRITFTDGREVICSKNHKWLARKLPTTSGKIQEWVFAKDLANRYCVVSPLEPWEEDYSYEAGWLAGIIDGEGSVHLGPKSGTFGVNISQKEGAVLDTAKEILTNMGFKFGEFGNSSKGNVMQIEVCTKPHVFSLLGRVRPVRILPTNPWDGVTIRSKGVERFAYIESVEEIGDMELVDIATTTKTFVANGLVSHNCDHSYRAKLLGLHEVNSPDTMVYHIGSAAIKSDQRLSLSNQLSHQKNFIYYQKKWGGINGEEKYMVPFNDKNAPVRIDFKNRHRPFGPERDRHGSSNTEASEGIHVPLV